ncbi:MAG: LysR family transcriptional regulator [Eubacteriales bacterium]
MTFRQMEIYIAVCEHKSMNQTAAACFISQQSVSKVIRELEEELGCTLLTRSKLGVIPTKRGRYLLNEFRIMVEKKKYLVENLADMQQETLETLRLGMAFGMISALPFHLMQDFEAQYPYVKIQYSDHTDYYLEQLLKKDEYDFCITTGVLDVDRVSCEQLTHESINLCIPRSHDLYDKSEIVMSDLFEESFAMYSTQFHIRHKFEQSCRRAGFIPHIAINSNDFNSLKELAINNNLLFIVPDHTENPHDTSVRYVPFPDESFHWGICFLVKKSKVISETMGAFYTHLKQSLCLSSERKD